MSGDYVAEVIESSTREIVAECRDLHRSPPFGSFVRIDAAPNTIYGLVSNISTRSIEPHRRPTAYGKTEEELWTEQPQIFELLKTEFQATILGYSHHTACHQILPPQPPRIHSFVYECEPDEVRRFTDQPDFLRMISASGRGASDELLIAAARTALEAHGRDRSYLITLGKELARLFKDDYDRLSSLVRRIAE